MEESSNLLVRFFPAIVIGLIYYFVFYKRAKEKAGLTEERLISIEQKLRDLESRVNK